MTRNFDKELINNNDEEDNIGVMDTDDQVEPAQDAAQDQPPGNQDILQPLAKIIVSILEHKVQALCAKYMTKKKKYNWIV